MSVARIAFAVLLALGPTAARAAGDQGTTPATAQADSPAGAAVHRAETAFLDTLDAHGALSYLESGGADRFGGRDLAAWRAVLADRRRQLDASLAAIPAVGLSAADSAAVAAMRRTVAAASESDSGDPRPCADARRRDLDFDAMRAALVTCFTEHGNRIRFRDGTVDRGTALQLLHVLPGPEERKALFAAFGPLWDAVNAGNEPDSPYRRLLGQAAAAAREPGSNIDAAARAIGVSSEQVERWLVRLLEAWRDATPGEPVEPWDYRFVHGVAGRELDERIGADLLVPVNERFYRDLGADLAALGVVYDLQPRPDKSPVAYTDFLVRGRYVDGVWRRPIARVLGTYPAGGLFSLNELVHENGHAVHVSAIHTRPAFMDWPDSLFCEAFGDVTSWSLHEPAWQRKYLGAAAGEAASLRALYANVMLDVAWSLFELRLLREPARDPNALWTELTQRYLNVRPHPEVPWWALRVQLVDDPGYMVNYGLGAVLTAEMRARTATVIGPFDTGNARWYPWLSEQLLRFGTERDTATLMREFLGRDPSPDALLAELRRIGGTP